MSAFHDIIIAGASGQQGYQISRSVRLRSSASAYFNRTPASATNQKTLTWSGWVKRGSLGTTQILLGTADSTSFTYNVSAFGFIGSTDILRFISTSNTGGSILQFDTTAVFRDPSAWYHVVLYVDTTQATNSNGIRIYVNGVNQAGTYTAYAQNTNTFYNSTIAQYIGRYSSIAPASYFNGYLTEINFIDGQALDPSYFGFNDSNTGVWTPRQYTGAYGTNGFYLNFSDNSGTTSTTLGKDYSGNGNNWTPNNISVTAGVTYDSMIDTPTPYVDGGNGRGNYAVLNPLNNPAAATFADGNLKVTNANSDYRGALSTIAIPTSGKWYWEIQSNATTSASSIVNMGIAPLGIPLSGNQNGYTNSAAWYLGNAVTYWIPGGTSIGASSTSDVFQIAYDAATGKVWLGRNNTWYWGNTSTNNTTGDPAGGTNQSFTLTPTEFYAWAFAYSNGFISNFGQRPFAYTPPTGFKALNTQNLPDSTIKKGNQYFDVAIQTRTGVASSVTGVGFQPDLVWDKARGFAYDHTIYDSVRGVQKELQSNTTAAETTQASGVTAFNSDGFSYGTRLGGSTTYVSWLWKESASAGFDIVTYTGTGAARTINHSLGVAPNMIVVKSRGTAATNWYVYHSGVSTPQGNYLVLNSTGAVSASTTAWNNTAPTSSVFSLGVSATNTNADTFVAYLFAEVAGFSKFGSYTGNGSTDGPFVFCGFRPRYVMFKRTDTTGDWVTLDSSRDTFNAAANMLYPNLSNAETNVGAIIDFLSNGFKLRFAGGASVNASGGTYIFAAFAETAFKFSLGR